LYVFPFLLLRPGSMLENLLNVVPELKTFANLDLKAGEMRRMTASAPSCILSKPPSLDFRTLRPRNPYDPRCRLPSTRTAAESGRKSG
jgi:hypothetical protein